MIPYFPTCQVRVVRFYVSLDLLAETLYSPRKLTYPPENQWLEDVFPIEKDPFLGDILVFGGGKIFCEFWFANHPVMNLCDYSKRIHTPNKIPPTIFPTKNQISSVSSPPNKFSPKIPSPPKSDLMIFHVQALQQCLCFWPGEAMLLKALAQSSLRLGDLPR